MTLAVQGALVPRKPACGIASPRSFYERLTRSIHSAEKSAQVAGQHNYRHDEGFDWQAIRRQGFTVVSPRPEVNPENKPNHHRRNPAEDQVLQQDPLQPLTF